MENKKSMKVLGIVHARGGSKRIPLKNIKELNGKPLIAYIITAGLKAKKLDRLIVSTDHPEIARIAKEYGAEVPFVRPPEISEDVATELVTQHAVKYLEEKESYSVDIAVTLQPTTPFCLPDDIDGCVKLLINSDADSVISACEIQERPEWMFYIDQNSYAKSFLDKELKGEIGISQTLPKLYIPNGGIYATRRDVLFEQNTIFGRKIKLWIMPAERSVDIDEPINLIFAEFVAKNFLKKKGIK